MIPIPIGGWYPGRPQGRPFSFNGPGLWRDIAAPPGLCRQAGKASLNTLKPRV